MSEPQNPALIAVALLTAEPASRVDLWKSYLREESYGDILVGLFLVADLLLDGLSTESGHSRESILQLISTIAVEQEALA